MCYLKEVYGCKILKLVINNKLVRDVNHIQLFMKARCNLPFRLIHALAVKERIARTIKNYAMSFL